MGQRFLVEAVGLLAGPEDLEQRRQQPHRVSMPGLDRQGRPIALRSGCVLPQRRQGQTQVGECVGIARTDRQGPLKALGRLRVAAQRLQGSPIIVVVDRLVRIDRDGTCDQLQCLLISPLLLADHAQEVQGTGVAGLLLEDLVIDLFRRGDLSALVQLERVIERSRIHDLYSARSACRPENGTRSATGYYRQQPRLPLFLPKSTHGIMNAKHPSRNLGDIIMPQPTAYQYVKLGSHLEFLRGIATASVMQTTSLAAFPELMGNLARRRYSVLQVVNVLKALLVQLEEMGLAESLRTAETFRPMLAEMEDFLGRQAKPEVAQLNDGFAERLIGLAKQLGTAVRSDLSMITLPSGNPISDL